MHIEGFNEGRIKLLTTKFISKNIISLLTEMAKTKTRS